jgi:hypothetical protein
MMAAKHSLDVVQGGNAFVVRLAVPEHNEAQLANAAMSFGVSVSEPAKYLQVGTKRGRGDPQPVVTIVRTQEERTFLIGCIDFRLLGQHCVRICGTTGPTARLGGPEPSILEISAAIFPSQPYGFQTS